MGNRAVITTQGSNSEDNLALYLHWHGGAESVLAFLEAARRLKIRGPKSDLTYCYGRLGQLVGNYLGGTTSLGVGPASQMDNSDNGTYYIDDKFNIVNRTEQGPMTLDELSPKEKAKYTNILEECLEINVAIFARNA